jgi:hypothetical protein
VVEAALADFDAVRAGRVDGRADDLLARATQ